MARDLVVRIIGDSRSLERSFARSERSAKKFERTMATTSSRLSRAGGIGAMFGVSGPTAAAGGAFLLGRQFVKAARDAEVILGQTAVAVQDAGLSWRSYAQSIEESSKRISDASAFDDEAVLQSFQVFVRGQKDVQKSMRLTELAADVARGRYIELDQATQLVNKAAMGQIGALRRAGIQIDKNATSAEALDALLKAYGNSAETYADSATGSSEKLAVAWENLSELAGGPLSDSLAILAGELTDVVALMEKAGKLHVPGFGGGGTLGKSVRDAAMMSLPGVGPLLAIGKLLGYGGGGGGVKVAGGGLGGVTAVFDAVEEALAGVARAAKGAAAVREANSTITGLGEFLNKWLTVGEKFGAAQEAAAKQREAAERHRARMELQRQRFRAGLENQWGWLEFGLERAQATKPLRDDRAILKKQEAWLKNRIAHAGRTLELSTKLWRVQEQIRDLNKKNLDVELKATRFQGRDPAKLAAMLGLGGNRRATALLAAYGAGGLPARGGQFAGAGTYVANQHFYGITDVNQFENAMSKNARAKPHNRRGAK